MYIPSFNLTPEESNIMIVVLGVMILLTVYVLRGK